MRKQYILIEHDTKNREIIDVLNNTKKIMYNNGDVVYLKDCNTIASAMAVRPYYGNGRILKYTDDNLLELDSVKIPELTYESKRYLSKKIVMKNLDKDEKFYEKMLSRFCEVTNITAIKCTKESILRFFGFYQDKK